VKKRLIDAMPKSCAGRVRPPFIQDAMAHRNSGADRGRWKAQKSYQPQAGQRPAGWVGCHRRMARAPVNCYCTAL